MNFFHFGSKEVQQEELSKLQMHEKSKIWHKCSEHKHYNGLPMEAPLLEGEIFKKGKIFKKNLFLKLYQDKMIFFKMQAGVINSHPHAIVFFEFDLKIQWHYIKEKKSEEEPNKVIESKLYGFKLIRGNNSIELITESDEFLFLMKQYTSALLISFNFYEDFLIVKPIGKGTSATVYLCEHLHSKQRYAVKACKKEGLYLQKEWKEILSAEINCLRALDHPNIIKLYALYETDKSFCLVFDLLEGGNLAHYLEMNTKGLNDEQCFHIMKGILSGLSHMHSRKIMHRDIKPENILFRKKTAYLDENNLCIADLGLATSQNVEKYVFFRCGTPGYIGPEVINVTDPNFKYSEKCDVFSAGAIMYHFLTGTKLFPGKDFNQVVMLNRKAHMDFNILKSKNIPEEAIDLVKKMLTRDSKNRISASDALLHPYFSPNLLKISLEEEEFSSKLNEIDIEKKVCINTPSIKDKFDFSGKNFNILKQNSQKSSNILTENDDNRYFNRDPAMNGFLETLNNISMQEIILMDTPLIEKKNIDKKVIKKHLEKSSKENQKIQATQ